MTYSWFRLLNGSKKRNELDTKNNALVEKMNNFSIFGRKKISKGGMNGLNECWLNLHFEKHQFFINQFPSKWCSWFFDFCIFYANPFIPFLMMLTKIPCFSDFLWISLCNFTLFLKNSDFAFILWEINQNMTKKQ